MNKAQSLFRSEVLAERSGEGLGPVLLTPKMSNDVAAGFAVLVTVAILGLLAFGTYPRKVHVNGMLVPEHGLVQVFSQPGQITEVNVAEGARVKKGDRLATMSMEQRSTLGVTGEQIARQLTARKESLLEDRRNLERLAEQQKKSLAERLAVLQATEAKMGGEMGVQYARIRSASRTVARQKRLSKEGLASEEHVQAAVESTLEQTTRLREIERSKLMTKHERLSLRGELEDLPLKLQRDIANVDRNIAMVDQELAELASRRESVIAAPDSGVVTAVQAKRGGHPDPKVPLMAIVPEGVGLEAHIFCSSRAIGFLKIGQHVLLRYESFPYQKFGHYEGTVTSVSHSAVNPAELETQVAGLSRVVGNQEAVYRVTVTLAAQSVRAYGRVVPLQPGMQLEADVVLENRRLIEWMFEPLFTISGTWKQR